MYCLFHLNKKDRSLQITGNRVEENMVQKEVCRKILFTYARRKAKPFVISGK